MMDPKNADWYWLEDNDEVAASSLEEATDYREIGDIACLRPLIELPKIYVVVGKTSKDDQIFSTLEEAEKYQE